MFHKKLKIPIHKKLWLIFGVKVEKGGRENISAILFIFCAIFNETVTALDLNSFHNY